MIKFSKLGGVLLGKDLGFLDIPKILAVLDILFCHYSILGYIRMLRAWFYFYLSLYTGTHVLTYLE